MRIRAKMHIGIGNADAGKHAEGALALLAPARILKLVLEIDKLVADLESEKLLIVVERD